MKPVSWKGQKAIGHRSCQPSALRRRSVDGLIQNKCGPSPQPHQIAHGADDGMHNVPGPAGCLLLRIEVELQKPKAVQHSTDTGAVMQQRRPLIVQWAGFWWKG